MSNESNEPAAPATGAYPLPDETSPFAPDTGPGTRPPSGLRVRDRVWSLRTVVAVAISAVALSGLGGAALAAAGDGGGSGPGQPNGQFPVPHNRHLGPPPGTGQLPPATTGEGGRDT